MKHSGKQSKKTIITYNYDNMIYSIKRSQMRLLSITNRYRSGHGCADDPLKDTLIVAPGEALCDSL